MRCSMKKVSGVIMIMAGVWLAVFWGCETLEPRDKALVIVPSSTNLTVAGQTVVFRAVVQTVTNMSIGGDSTNQVVTGPPLVMPLTWSVSDPSLGRIHASGGTTAIYERNGAAEGNNYIHVRDASHRYEDVATVTQLPVP